MFREGDFVAIPLPHGREALGRVLYLSSYFKNVIGFAVYGVKDTLSATDVSSLQLDHPKVLYTNVVAAAHYKWRVLAHQGMTDHDRLLTKRIVGGEIWIGDEFLGKASAEDDAKLPRMLVGGMPVVYRQIARAFV